MHKLQIRYLLRATCNTIATIRHCTATTTTTTTTATKATTITANEEAASGLLTAAESASKRSNIKMSGWQIHNYGGIDELQFSNALKIPQIKSSADCLVKIHATAVNPIDVAQCNGYGATILNMMRCQPGDSIEFPLTLGREFCGEIVQKGMGVDKLQLGERVWGVVPLQSSIGAHAEYVTVPSYCLTAAPEALSDEEAASVLYAGLTAWSGLYITGGLGGVCGATTASGGGANKRILVLGGSGAVGSLAIQILKSQNVQVLTTCNEDAVELVRTLGADHVVDYCNPVEMQLLSSYAPYDIILDCAGQGADHANTFKFDFKQYITFNSPVLRNIDQSGLGLGMLKNVANLLETNAKALTQQGGLVKWGFFAPAPHGIEFLKRLVERKKLLPLIDSTYEFAKLPEAFERVQKGHLRGKVVVKLTA